MKELLNEMYAFRHLLSAFVVRNIQVKYKQTFMGFLWAVFMPIVIVLSGVIVKKAMATFSKEPVDIQDIVSVSIKALPWAFFVGALKFAVGSLVSNMSLVSKIYFPKVFFPITYVCSAFFDFLVSIIAFMILFIPANIGISIHILWVPFLILLLLLFTTGLSMLLACANLFFRDVRYIVDVVLTFAIFFTPVFYDASMFSNLKTFFLLNPIGTILETTNRVVVLHLPPEYGWLIYTTIVSVVIFLVGWKVFHQMEPEFAEHI